QFLLLYTNNNPYFKQNPLLTLLTRDSQFNYLLFICGNNNTSLIDVAFVSSITKRSIPIPKPPVGGIPYSNASKKSVSIDGLLHYPLLFLQLVFQNVCVDQLDHLIH